MRQQACNIWDLHPLSWVVVPTNIGWKKNGSNVMGAGLAKEAASRFRGLARWYGKVCQDCGFFTPVVKQEEWRVILFPVKPLNELDPHLSWKSPATVELIERSAKELAILDLGPDAEVAVPLVGCGNGRLREKDVVPILEKHLSSSRFLLVRTPAPAF